MTDTVNTPITSFAAIDHSKHVRLGDYDWAIFAWHDRKSLRPYGDRQLVGCSIDEYPAKDGKGPTFAAGFDHPDLSELSARSGPLDTLAEAVAWAVNFQWASRTAGSLTWLARSADAKRWRARIGNSEAVIDQGGFGDTFIVTRELRLGNQKVKFEISDLAFGKDEPKAIATFEQASAIALTMADYVLELMRGVESGSDQ